MYFIASCLYDYNERNACLVQPAISGLYLKNTWRFAEQYPDRKGHFTRILNVSVGAEAIFTEVSSFGRVF